MITPEGILSRPLAALAGMIADSPAFQAWVGAADAAQAQGAIHLLQSAREPALPLCLIDYGDGFERERVGITVGRPFEQRGQLIAYFRDAVSAGVGEAEAIYTFCNQLGAVWADLERMVITGDRVLITAIALIAAPARIEAERRPHAGDLFEAALGITWRAMG